MPEPRKRLTQRIVHPREDGTIPIQLEKRVENSHRSAVTNGKALVPDVDGRSSFMRRLRDVYQAMVEDMGGEDQLTESQIGLVKQTASLFVIGEDMLKQRATNNGDPAIDPYDLLEHITLIRTLSTSVKALGSLKRVAKDVTPDLRAYLKEHKESKD